MKKHGIANSHISDVLGKMGHTDTIAIADYGLPIPDHVLRIDLAYDSGKPGFIEILEAVLADFNAEKITLAHEIKEKNIAVEKHVLKLTQEIPAEYVSHEAFKELTKEAKAIIRTGENTPYANIILHSGVNF